MLAMWDVNLLKVGGRCVASSLEGDMAPYAPWGGDLRGIAGRVWALLECRNPCRRGPLSEI